MPVRLYHLVQKQQVESENLGMVASAVRPTERFPEDYVPVGGEHPPHYEIGVFQTSGQLKGGVIKALLKVTPLEVAANRYLPSGLNCRSQTA